MDSAERELREMEFAFRNSEFKQRERHHVEQKKLVQRTAFLSVVTLGISILALAATFRSQERQYQESSRQFQQTLQRDEYGQIVTGLSSSSVAVQDSSMRRLIAFVRNRSNFPNRKARSEGYSNAIQTFTAFIADESLRPGHVGLTQYQNPQPIIVPRAMRHLMELTSDKLGAEVIDISRADLHGAWLPGWRPSAHILTVGADFRRANLSGLDLRSENIPSSLNSAFFTCANLSDSELGPANLAGADLTGADLSGADLSRVNGLERHQLHGVTVTPATVLPDPLSIPSKVGWKDSDRCYNLVNDMTGMRGAQGYTSKLPCPSSVTDARRMEIEPPWRGELTDLVNACQLRNGQGGRPPN